MRIDKVFNNNAVLAVGDGRRRVLLGRGIAFGRRRGDEVDLAQAEQVFTLEQDHPEHLPAQLAGLPLAHLRAAAHAGRIIEQALGKRLSQAQLIALADHISFAARRATDGLDVDYPLRWEVTQLYPHETEVARRLVAAVEDDLRLELPAGEDSALALHLVTLQFDSARVAESVAMTQTITDVIQIVRDSTSRPIPPESLALARFVTHLRYLFLRAQQDAPQEAMAPALAPAIREAYADWMPIARNVQHHIEERHGCRLGPTEVSYLALHIARLVSLDERSPRPDARDDE